MQTPTLDELKNKLSVVEANIKKLEGSENNSYTAQLARSFPFGRVGGSGRRTASLNRRRERELDKTIDTAKECVQLYKERDKLQACINDIESGGPEKRAAAKDNKNKNLAEWWKALKVGDDIHMSNNPILVTKKNAKSVEAGAGCKWSAAEVIGKDAAALL